MSSAKKQFNCQARDYWPSMAELDRCLHDFRAFTSLTPTTVYLNPRDYHTIMQSFKMTPVRVLPTGRKYAVHLITSQGVVAIFSVPTLHVGVLEIDSEDFDEEFEKIILGEE